MGLSMQEQINWLQRFIILHSYIYYELNDNAISDRVYDMRSRELVRLKELYPDLWKTSEYYKQFGDEYNGSTGFSLYHDLSNEQKETIRIIAAYRNKHNKH
jgi:NAD-dependent DNA ligase